MGLVGSARESPSDTLALLLCFVTSVVMDGAIIT